MPSTASHTEDTANTRVEAWEDRTEWILVGAAVVFLAAYAWPILDTSLPRGVERACHNITWVTWALFAVDYVIRLVIADHRLKFFRENLVDLAVVVLPMLRSLRMLQLVKLLRLLNRRATSTFRGQVAAYVVASTVVIMFVAALAALDAERGHPDANITTFGDAIWWSAATVTTVGYGDHFPVTLTGRFVAGGLMLAGIALLGVVTASLASWFLERVEELGDEAQAATRQDVQNMSEVIKGLQQQLRGANEELARLRAAHVADPRVPNPPPAPHED